MQYLSIDTTTQTIKLACLNTQTGAKFSIEKEVGRNQAEFLHETLQTLLNQANLTVKQIDNIIVNVGPGSYTSLRLGIATAKALALPFNIKVTAVNSFDLLTDLYTSELTDYAIVLKNTEKQIYIAHNNKQEVQDVDHLSSLDRSLAIIGNGVEFYAEQLSEHNTIKTAQIITALDLIDYVIKKDIQPTELIQPLYLKPLEYRKTNPIS